MVYSVNEILYKLYKKEWSGFMFLIGKMSRIFCKGKRIHVQSFSYAFTYMYMPIVLWVSLPKYCYATCLSHSCVLGVGTHSIYFRFPLLSKNRTFLWHLSLAQWGKKKKHLPLIYVENFFEYSQNQKIPSLRVF